MKYSNNYYILRTLLHKGKIYKTHNARFFPYGVMDSITIFVLPHYVPTGLCKHLTSFYLNMR